VTGPAPVSSLVTGPAPVSSLVIGPLLDLVLIEIPIGTGALFCSVFDLLQQAPAADVANSKLLAGPVDLFVKEA
jgi:hypothetical protein